MTTDETVALIRKQAATYLAGWEKHPPRVREKIWTTPATVRYLNAVADRLDRLGMMPEDAQELMQEWAEFILLAVKVIVGNQPKERYCIVGMRLNRLCEAAGTTAEWVLKGEQPKG